MATVSEIFSRAAFVLGDKLYSATTKQDMARLANDAQDIIVMKTKCLQDEYCFALVAHEREYSLPSDCLKVITLFQNNNNKLTSAPPFPVEEYDTQNKGEATILSKFYVKQSPYGEQKLVVYPRPSSSSSTYTLSGNINALVTDIPMTAAWGKPDYGRIKIDNEVMEHFLGTLSNGTSNGVALGASGRGAQGTTATTHSSGATITYLEMRMRYLKRADQLVHTSLSTTPNIPVQYHHLIEYYIVSQAASRRDSGLANKYTTMFYDGLDRMVAENSMYDMDPENEQQLMYNYQAGPAMTGNPSNW